MVDVDNSNQPSDRKKFRSLIIPSKSKAAEVFLSSLSLLFRSFDVAKCISRRSARCLILVIWCSNITLVRVTASNPESLIPEISSQQPQQQQQQQQQQPQQQQHASLVQSVWDTIRSSLEAAAVTRRGIGSHTAHSSLEDDDDDDGDEERHTEKKYPHTIAPRNDQLSHQVTGRRRALLERSLRFHYATYLQGSAKPLGASYFSHHARQQTSSSLPPPQIKVEPQSSWPVDGGCVAFNEHQKSYWTYIWCPQQFLQQVHIPLVAGPGAGSAIGGSVAPASQDDEAMIQTFVANGGQSHELGNWLSHDVDKNGANKDENSDKNEFPWQLSWTGSYLEQLARTMSTTLQTWHVEEYGNGDWCQPLVADAMQRETLVIIFTDGELPCVHNMGSSKNGNHIRRILDAVEPQPCHYVLHVCAPSPDNAINGTTVLGQDMNLEVEKGIPDKLATSNEEADQARHNRNVKSYIQYFLHQSTQDNLVKSQPDRTTLLDAALPPFPESMRQANCKLIQDMFRHAYDSYMYHAYPAPELRPLTCKPGTFNLVKLKALTLIDALDTLVVLGNYTEFARSVERLRQLDMSMRKPHSLTDDEEEEVTVTQGGLFAVDQNVSVFETNIRVLGGLLSAHQLAVAFLKNRVLESDVWDWQGDVLWGESSSRRQEATTDDQGSDKDINPCLADVHLHEVCGSTLQQVVSASTSGESVVKENLRQCRNTTDRQGKHPVTYWTYDGFFLTLARDIGTRLLPAFDSKTGIPYGTVNLLYGVPKGETPIASLAGGGTLTLEMELLSRLTGDEVFGKAAKLSSRALWTRRSSLNLFGKHINIHTGDWTETLSGIGSNSDSFYEYLVKHYIVFPEDEDFWTMMTSAYTGVHNSTRLGEWYADVDMNLGTRSGGARRVFESLMAFYPGMQVLLGEVQPAARTLNSYIMVREFLGFLPERFNYANWKVDGGLRGAGRHPLRPEILESNYFLHRATKTTLRHRSNATYDSSSARSISGWSWASDFALHALESMTRVECGYAGVKELSPSSSGTISMDGLSQSDVKLYNEMPSFFLSETLKYLYLTFDEDNILHADDKREWIFTTEAHPIHHEPIKTGPRHKLETMKQSLKRMLKSRLHLEAGHGSRKVYGKTSVANEKWTEQTKLRNFRTSFEQAVTELKHRGKEHRLRRAAISDEAGDLLIEVIVPSRDIVWGNDNFAEGERSENVAHLSFGSLGVGEGSILKKACFNIYNPELLWLRALRGGGLDYTDVYISAAADDPGKEFQPSNRYMLLGSADALGYQGSSVSIGLPELQRRPGRSCPVLLQTASVSEREQEPGPPEGAVRYDMGPNVGSFDVSVFADGGGFYVQHVESKERVIATMIVQDENKDAYVMAYTSMPPLPQIGHRQQKTGAESSTSLSSRWGSWKNMFRRRRGSGVEKVLLPERTVVLSDIRGNAFVCDIQILLRSTLTETEADGNDAETVDGEDLSNANDFTTKDELLAHFPCAPGFFGAAHISNLIATDGLVVEEVIRAPDDGNEFGCDGSVIDNDSEFQPTMADIFVIPARDGRHVDDRVDDTCPNAVVQVVRRGTCTFESKAMNQKRLNNASAIIVVNDVDEDLFVMSRGQDTDDNPTIPVTVLVTGADGEGILSLMADHAKVEGQEDYLVARISLVRQGRIGSNQEGQFLVDWSGETPVWPIVRASAEAVQIFARGGWGVHAMRTGGEPQVSWQLFLLQHQLHVGGNGEKGH